MKTKLTPIAAAAAVAIAGAVAAPAFAQSAAAPAASASAAKADDVQRVEVTGIRASLQSSINQKRSAESHVEVITAEDIGKLPDKNVADSLAHLSGVTISSAGANEGGFDESDRVSMRGTSPSLTQTLINGHNVATGDWFVLDQTGTVGRSVSYTLLPTEIVSSVVVHKSSEASLVEGGVAGSVDIITRKPLDFKKQLSAAVSIGAVYADRPAKTDPQLSALVNWKNESGTFGVLLQGFFEKRHLRRDGIEVLGYDTFAADSAAVAAHPDLAGVKYPHLIGDALFLQERKRTGGLIDLELKPNESTTLDLNGFISNMSATNVNRNYMFDGRTLSGAQGGNITNYTVQNGYLTSATVTNAANQDVGVYDQISRPNEGARSQYVDFDGKFQLTDKFRLKSQIGFSSGYGKTPQQDIAETETTGSGSFQLNGASAAASFSLPDASTPGDNTRAAWIFGDQNMKVNDSEKWAQLDGEFDIEVGPLAAVKFGVRGADHKRSLWGVIGQGPTGDWTNLPASTTNYPGNFADGLTSGVPQNVWTFTPAQLAAYNAAYANRTASAAQGSYGDRQDYGSDYGVRESTTAGYVQGDLEGANWSGNVGLRLVNTTENVQFYMMTATAQPGGNTDSAFCAAAPTWADGSCNLTSVHHSYTDLLPSLNLRYNLSKDLVARFAASRTMTRADYSQLAGSVSLGQVDDTNLTGSGSGGNPDLKPITSNNADISFEWYFAPRSLLSASVFYMDVTSYIGLGSVHRSYSYKDAAYPNGAMVDFLLTVPYNISAKVHGVELAWEQPIWGNFGGLANYSRTSSSTADGSPMVGTSKSTYNVGAYFENDFLNARVTYNHRSSFYSGLDRATAYYQAGTGDLTASVGWTFNKNFNVTLDGRNLNHPKLRYYEQSGQPRASYENGAQYYLTAHYSY